MTSSQLLVERMSSISIDNMDRVVLKGGGPFFAFLPEELVIKIFTFLPLPDVAFKMAKLGDRRISNLCQDHELWSKVNVSRDWGIDTTCKMTVFMTAGAKVKKLTLCRPEQSAILVTALASCPNLESLTLDQTDFSEEVMVAIEERSKSLQKLKVTNDTRKFIWEHRYLSRIANSLVNLTTLDVASTFLEDVNNTEWLNSLADRCEKIDHLYLSFAGQLNDEALENLLEKTKKRLKSLTIDGSRLTDASLLKLKDCPLLKVLGLSYMRQLEKKGLRTLAEVSSGLRRLGISCAVNTGKDFADAFAGKVMHHLLYLELYECRELDDVGVVSIARACPNLKMLELLSCHKIGDVGVIGILGSCKKLRELWMSGAKVTAKAFDGRSCGELRSLHLQADGPNVAEIANVMSSKCEVYGKADLSSELKHARNKVYC